MEKKELKQEKLNNISGGAKKELIDDINVDNTSNKKHRESQSLFGSVLKDVYKYYKKQYKKHR